MRTRKLLAASFVAVVALLVPMVAPAAAHPAVAVFAGTATTDPTWFPVSPFCGRIPCPSGPIAWNIGSEIASVVVEVGGIVSASPNQVRVQGHSYGWCGHSQGGIGLGAGVQPGSATIGSHEVQLDLWVSVGSTFILQGHAGASVAAVIFQVRPMGVIGVVPCLTHGATNFTVVGLAVVVP